MKLTYSEVDKDKAKNNRYKKRDAAYITPDQFLNKHRELLIEILKRLNDK